MIALLFHHIRKRSFGSRPGSFHLPIGHCGSDEQPPDGACRVFGSQRHGALADPARTVTVADARTAADANRSADWRGQAETVAAAARASPGADTRSKTRRRRCPQSLSPAIAIRFGTGAPQTHRIPR